jgi:hypothetical protein
MSTMIRAGDRLSDLCREQGLRVQIRYVDLWVSDTLLPNTDVVVEMFPYYKGLAIPVINGKRFITRQGEKELLAELVSLVREINRQHA